MMEMRSKRDLIARAIICLGIGAICTPGQAQILVQPVTNRAEAQSVAARPKASYDPTGIPLGSFRLYALTGIQLSYDNNIYNTDARRRADGAVTLTPRFDLQSRSPDRSLALSADATIQRYDSLHSENNEQYNLAGEGRLSVGRATTVSIGGYYGRRSEPRGVLGDVLLGAPNQFVRSGGDAGVTVELVDVVLSANAAVESRDYKPVDVGGVRILQDFRDLAFHSGNLRASLQVGPGLRLFTQGTYNALRYRERFGAINRDSKGYLWLGGVNFGLTELIGGEIGVGYLAQMYDQKPTRTVSGMTYAGKIVWNPTPLLTATLSGRRVLEPSPFFDQMGVIEDNVDFRLDYELLRNLVISIAQRWTFDDFRGLDRRDSRYTSDVMARYLISRTLEVRFRINHRRQWSSGTFARRYAGTSAMISFEIKR